MGSVQAKRYHDICAGHRVVGQGGKCEHLHGHNYRFHFTIEAAHADFSVIDGGKGVMSDQHNHDGLDNVGRVLDFSVIKSILCEWLEEQWDHKMLLWEQDPMYAYVKDIDNSVVRLPFNPTAENLAEHMVNLIAPNLFESAGVHCVLVECTIEETAKCSATYKK